MGHLEAEWMRYWLDIHEGKYASTKKSERVRKTSRRRDPGPFDGLTIEMPDFAADITADFRRLATESQRQVQQAAERLARIDRFQLGGRSRPAKRSGRRAAAASR